MTSGNGKKRTLSRATNTEEEKLEIKEIKLKEIKKEKKEKKVNE